MSYTCLIFSSYFSLYCLGSRVMHWLKMLSASYLVASSSHLYLTYFSGTEILLSLPLEVIIAVDDILSCFVCFTLYFHFHHAGQEIKALLEWHVFTSVPKRWLCTHILRRTEALFSIIKSMWKFSISSSII